MKNISMSNREFKKERKYFKKKFIEGNLTEAVRKTEEYKFFELEEEKRKKANDFVKECLETAEVSPSFLKMVEIYLNKYENFVARRDVLEAEFKNLYNDKKMDYKTFTECINDKVFEFKKRYEVERIVGISVIQYAKLKFGGYDFNQCEKYRREYEEVFLWLRRETCAFGVALNKMRKKLENIKKRELEFLEANRVRDIKFRLDGKAREFEYSFLQRDRV